MNVQNTEATVWSMPVTVRRSAAVTVEGGVGPLGRMPVASIQVVRTVPTGVAG